MNSEIRQGFGKLKQRNQERRHGVDWGGHVHPTFLKIIFLIGLNSMKKGWGGGRF